MGGHRPPRPGDSGRRSAAAASAAWRSQRRGRALLARASPWAERATLADVEGGAEALSELDFCDVVRRFGLPEPDRQFERVDEQGRRWLDAVWEWARLVVEIDGRWHMDARAWWEDMQRGNELQIDGYRVLRFPAFAVRDYPRAVAAQIARALGQAGLDVGRAAI